MSVIEIITVSAALIAAIGAWCTPCTTAATNLIFSHMSRILSKYTPNPQKEESNITTNSKMVCYFEKDKPDFSV